MSRRRFKETKDQECRRKLYHPDYLAALFHARSLNADGIVIYPCTVCDGLHPGHPKTRHTAHCEREGKATVSALVRRIRKHEQIIAEHKEMLLGLMAKLDMATALYETPMPFFDQEGDHQ